MHEIYCIKLHVLLLHQPDSWTAVYQNTTSDIFDVQWSVHRECIFKYNQQDATLHISFISAKCSTCFRRFLHLKHVEHFAEINELYKIASCWLYLEINKKKVWYLHIYTIRIIDLATPLHVLFNRHKTETDYITHKVSLHTSWITWRSTLINIIF
jgi:hypothetical protein